MNPQLLRAEDVLRCGSPYGDCELWDGIAMVREPSGGEAEFVAAEVVGSLQQHVRRNNVRHNIVRGNRLGWVFLSQVEKCGLWIAHGAACVWAIDPLDRVVAEFRQGTDPVVHRAGVGTASATPALPEFSIDLMELFADLAD